MVSPTIIFLAVFGGSLWTDAALSQAHRDPVEVFRDVCVASNNEAGQIERLIAPLGLAQQVGEKFVWGADLLSLQVRYSEPERFGAHVSRCKVTGETARSDEIDEIAAARGMVELECKSVLGYLCSDSATIRIYVAADCAPPVASFERPGCTAISYIGDRAPSGSKIFRSINFVKVVSEQ